MERGEGKYCSEGSPKRGVNLPFFLSFFSEGCMHGAMGACTHG